MSDIVKDIVEDIEIKPNRTKFILKWGGRIGLFLISLAFVLGQLKSAYFGRLDKFEKTLDNNTKANIELKRNMNAGFEKINAKIDKIYIDGYNEFNDYQQYSKKQLEIIVDYGQTNKELVKKFLDVNMLEKNKNVENHIQKEKKETISIGVRPIK
jgi:hypothetical protein